MPARRLTRARLAAAAAELAGRDPALGAIHRRLGPPPLWGRPPGFPTLVRIVLEQQVSLASAWATYRRLEEAVGEVTPAAVLALDDEALRAAGFSRQKAGYCRRIAAAVAGGAIDLAALARLDDDEARSRLVELPGIGRWSADIYLLMALGRPDVWPVGDLALAVAAAEVRGQNGPLPAADLEAAGEPWRPWRAVAARMLWQHYLDRRGR